MRYALQDLLDIRERRERAASEKVVKQRHRVSDAVRSVEGRKEELMQYHDWRLGEEESLFGGVIGRRIRVRQLEQVRNTISWLREGELMYEKKVTEAEIALESERKALTEAQQKQQAANRDLQKIEEHEQIWLEEWTREQEVILERELEDLSSRRRDDDEEDEPGAEGDDDGTD